MNKKFHILDIDSEIKPYIQSVATVQTKQYFIQ